MSKCSALAQSLLRFRLSAPDMPSATAPRPPRIGFVSSKYSVSAVSPSLPYTGIGPPYLMCTRQWLRFAKLQRIRSIGASPLVTARPGPLTPRPGRWLRFVEMQRIFSIAASIPPVCTGQAARHRTPTAADWLRFAKVQRIRRQPSSFALSPRIARPRQMRTHGGFVLSKHIALAGPAPSHSSRHFRTPDCPAFSHCRSRGPVLCFVYVLITDSVKSQADSGVTLRA